eukprot:3716467-Pyramimonas_sp.AAC.1
MHLTAPRPSRSPLHPPEDGQRQLANKAGTPSISQGRRPVSAPRALGRSAGGESARRPAAWPPRAARRSISTPWPTMQGRRKRRILPRRPA